MKMTMIALTLFLGSTALAGNTALSYNDSIKLKKTVVNKNLPAHFMKLHRVVNFEDKRMIAGKFEIAEKRAEKKSYLDGLRSKLEGCTGLGRF